MPRNFIVVLLMALGTLVAAATPTCNRAFRSNADNDSIQPDPDDPDDVDPDDPDSTPPLAQELQTAEGFSIFYPEGWSAAPSANLYQIVNVPADQLPTLDAAAIAKLAQIIVFTEQRADHLEALRRLTEIEAEVDSPSTFLAIDGWPALQRRHLTPRPQSGAPDDSGPSASVLQVTTAVAAGSLLVRLEAMLPDDVEAKIVDTVEAIGRSLRFPTAGDPAGTAREIQQLQQRGPSEP